ncbi:hypothetical protein Hypma_002643 [Hypsizygus marmoreus]|uniref:Uncharacterized protein n=1 Tax=Hypsizygus marmoreus TaxID=39966 RepID=A0A369J5X8_HYPMA|nr:hypothetical protein Hypma_002643 [Hypsizygus marmoreus]
MGRLTVFICLRRANSLGSSCCHKLGEASTISPCSELRPQSSCEDHPVYPLLGAVGLGSYPDARGRSAAWGPTFQEISLIFSHVMPGPSPHRFIDNVLSHS